MGTGVCTAQGGEQEGEAGTGQGVGGTRRAEAGMGPGTLNAFLLA